MSARAPNRLPDRRSLGGACGPRAYPTCATPCDEMPAPLQATSMSWQTITVIVPDEMLKDAIVGEFAGDGIAGVWERPHEPGSSEIVLYFTSGALPPLAVARIQRVFGRNGYSSARYQLGEEETVDWTVEWRKGFSSFEVGQRFRVVPGWEDPPSGDSRINLRIDPGMAFGTGTHETTRTVLEMLEALDISGVVLDMGTGSGILTIAARKLGGGRRIACDVDADAVAVARRNLERNDVCADLFVGSVTAIRSGSIALVLANLTSEVIARHLFQIRRVLAPTGQAVLAGILASQALLIEESFAEEGMMVRERRDCGEWVAYLVEGNGR